MGGSRRKGVGRQRSAGSGASEPAVSQPNDTVGSPCPAYNTPVVQRRHREQERPRSPPGPGEPSQPARQLALLPAPADSEATSAAQPAASTNDSPAASNAIAIFGNAPPAPPSGADGTPATAFNVHRLWQWIQYLTAKADS